MPLTKTLQHHHFHVGATCGLSSTLVILQGGSTQFTSSWVSNMFFFCSLSSQRPSPKNRVTPPISIVQLGRSPDEMRKSNLIYVSFLSLIHHRRPSCRLQRPLFQFWFRRRPSCSALFIFDFAVDRRADCSGLCFFFVRLVPSVSGFLLQLFFCSSAIKLICA